MLLYKYRSLENFEYVLDIILNEHLHCAPYENLNAPFEGIFKAVHTAPGTLGDGIGTLSGKLPTPPASLAAMHSENNIHDAPVVLRFVATQRPTVKANGSIHNLIIFQPLEPGYGVGSMRRKRIGSQS
ncbi:MAG: hypothetical protein WCG03_00870 [Kiritimatiellales bacterium]